MDTQLGSFSAHLSIASLALTTASANGSSLAAVFSAAGATAQLSARETGVFQSLGSALARGGELDAGTSADLLGGIGGFSARGVSAFPQGAFSASTLARYQGSPLFAGLASYSVNALVQKFEDALFRDTANNLLDMADSSQYTPLLRSALDGINLSTLSASDRSQILGMLSFAVASGGPSLQQAQALLAKLAQTQGSGWSYANALSNSGGQFSYQVTGQGTADINLGDGFTVHINQANSELDLVDHNTGHTTVIWGDPHMGMDGNNNQFQFKGNVTLNLPDGTKITLQTTKYDLNDQYLTKNLVITRGDQSIVVGNMDQNAADAGKMTVRQYDGAGALERMMNPDGTELYLNSAGNGWNVLEGGVLLRPMTEQDLQMGDLAQQNPALGFAFNLGFLFGLGAEQNQDGGDSLGRLLPLSSAAR